MSTTNVVTAEQELRNEISEHALDYTQAYHARWHLGQPTEAMMEQSLQKILQYSQELWQLLSEKNSR